MSDNWSDLKNNYAISSTPKNSSQIHFVSYVQDMVASY